MTFAFASLLILLVAVSIVAWNEHRRVTVWQEMWRTVSAQLARRDTRVAHLEYENQELHKSLQWWRNPLRTGWKVKETQANGGNGGTLGGTTGQYKLGPDGTVEYWSAGGGGDTPV